MYFMCGGERRFQPRAGAYRQPSVFLTVVNKKPKGTKKARCGPELGTVEPGVYDRELNQATEARKYDDGKVREIVQFQICHD